LTCKNVRFIIPFVGLSGLIVVGIGFDRLGRKAEPELDDKAVPGVDTGSGNVSDLLLFLIFFGFYKDNQVW
jgi:hypothetical protein